MRLEEKIFRILRERDASAAEIVEEILVSPNKVLETLSRFEELGLLNDAWRNGRRVYILP